MTNGVLIQPSFLGTDNSFMLAALKQYPERLRGVVVIDPVRDLAKLEEWNTSCCVGIRLNLIGLPDPDLSSPEWTAVLTKLRALNWQVEIQVESARMQKLVEPILKRKVTVVVDHFGRPDPNLGVDDPGFRYLLTLGPTGNVWVKLSGAYRNGANGRGEQIALQAMPMLRQSFGLKRLIWGSDWPHTQFEETLSYDKAFAFFETLLPDPNDRKVVLWDSPSHLFRFVPSYAAHH
jgi:predicted TIM-barrel fold metal-dependent hydrolase